MRVTLFGAGGGEVAGSAYLVESEKSKPWFVPAGRSAVRADVGAHTEHPNVQHC
jgi:hypothetical protein